MWLVKKKSRSKTGFLPLMSWTEHFAVFDIRFSETSIFEEIGEAQYNEIQEDDYTEPRDEGPATNRRVKKMLVLHNQCSISSLDQCLLSPLCSHSLPHSVSPSSLLPSSLPLLLSLLFHLSLPLIPSCLPSSLPFCFSIPIRLPEIIFWSRTPSPTRMWKHLPS